MDGDDLDLVTATLRADSSDVGAFVESLAVKLEETLPGRTKVDRRGRLLGAKRVRKISVETADERLVLVCGDGDAIETSRAKVSGGIVLKNEMLGTDEWLRALGAALSAEAQRSEQTRRALERLLLG